MGTWTPGPGPTDGDDTFAGDAAHDTADGGAGNDDMSGNDGDDELGGGEGDDFLNGGRGRDTLEGGQGNDEIIDFEDVHDPDTLRGGPGYDYLIGNHTDIIDGGDDLDVAIVVFQGAQSGATLDLSTFAPGSTRALPGGGQLISIEAVGIVGTHYNDTFALGGWNGYLEGLDGDDDLSGGAGNDQIYGGNGDDILRGSAHPLDRDWLEGGYGDDVVYASGADTVRGDAGYDRLYITFLGNPNGAQFDGRATWGFEYAEVVGSEIRDRIDPFLPGRYEGLGDDDYFAVYSSSATILGGNGNDRFQIMGGSSNDIFGGDGDDELSLSYADWSSSNNTFDGGSGFDTLQVSQTAIAPNFRPPLEVDLRAGGGPTSFGFIITNVEQLWAYGGSGPDRIYGASGDDIIHSFGGGDIVDGGDGDDVILDEDGIGSFAPDHISGGGGDDRITIFATVGDSIHGGSGHDIATVYLRDPLFSSNVIDLRTNGLALTITGIEVLQLRGSSTPVTIIGTDQADNLGGASFADTLYGGGGDDFLFGAHGDDVLRGEAGADTIDGYDGDDVLFGGDGDDFLDGDGYAVDAGFDIFHGGAGADTIHGGAMPDTVSHEFDPARVAVNLSANEARDGWGFIDRLQSIENATGSSFGDALVGSDGDNLLSGLGGDDVMSGGAGSDVLIGGAGRDEILGESGADTFVVAFGDFVAGEFIDGGDGFDTLRTIGSNVDYRVGVLANIERMHFQQQSSETTINAMINASQIGGSGLLGNLVVSGSAAQDSVQIFVDSGATVNTSSWTFDYPSWGFEDYLVYVGDAGAETMMGFPGLDIFFGSPGNDTYNGNGAFDFAAYIFSPNAVTADLAIVGPQAIGGNQGSDTFINLEGLAGSQLADQLFGDHQNNILLGLYGDDYLAGRAGDDDLRGAEGADRIEGGMGADVLWGYSDLSGGADGADTFVYRSAAEGGDTIRDFVAGSDRIEVSAAGFGGGLVAGQTVQFTSGVNPIASSAGGSFLYNTSNGQLSWDADGSGAGAAMLLVTLLGAPALTAANIVVTGIASSLAAWSGGPQDQPSLIAAGAGAEDEPFDFGGIAANAATAIGAAPAYSVFSDLAHWRLFDPSARVQDEPFSFDADGFAPPREAFAAWFGRDGVLGENIATVI